MNTIKPQLLYIHGGMTFRDESEYQLYLQQREIRIEKKVRWSETFLDRELWVQMEIIRPRMPLQDNAKYNDWKMHFERHFEYLNDWLTLVWESLWWVFLAQYLSENIFPRKISQVLLVCPPFDNTLIGEELVGGFELGDNLAQLEENCDDVTLFFSKDDDCVPVGHAEKYRSKLNKSSIIILNNKNWHFNVPEFPEFVASIKEKTE